MHGKYEVCKPLNEIFGSHFDFLWSTKEHRNGRYLHAVIANQFYIIDTDTLSVAAGGKGKKRPPEIFVKLVETELKNYYNIK